MVAVSQRSGTHAGHCRRRRATAGMALVISWLGCGCSLSSLDHLQEGDDGSAGEARVESNTGGSSETPNPGSGGSAPGTGGTGSDSPTAGTGPDVSAAGTGTDVSTGGMGPEPSTGGTAGGPDCPLCELQATLIHRYSFNGTGTEATDSVGNAHGTIVDASLDGSGSLTLDGGAESQYVDLPDRIVSVLPSATFEAWVTWQGGDSGQRVFDFGDQNTGRSNGGQSYVFLSAKSQLSGTLRAAFRRADSQEDSVSDSTELALGSVSHVAVVVDPDTETISLYRDGVLRASDDISGTLSDINDVNVWLGRSQFESDAWFSGTFYEFRIYGTALTEAQVSTSYEAGPDATLAAT